MRAGCLRRFRAFCLGGDEVGVSLVVLAPGLGGWGPAGDEGRWDGGSARRGRRALRITGNLTLGAELAGSGAQQIVRRDIVELTERHQVADRQFIGAPFITGVHRLGCP